MKRRILFFVLILTFVFTTAAFAVELKINDVNVKFDDNSGYPFIDANNRTQVPLRAAMEAFGAAVEWDAQNQTAIVKKGNVTVKVPVGKAYIFKNDMKIDNDTSAIIKNSRTYLPIRVVLEAFGAQVGWENNTVTVKATSEGFYSDVYSVEADDVMISPKEVYFSGNTLVAEMYVYNDKNVQLSNLKDIEIELRNKDIVIASGYFDSMDGAVIPPKSYILWTFEFGPDTVMNFNADMSFLETIFSVSYDYQ